MFYIGYEDNLPEKQIKNKNKTARAREKYGRKAMRNEKRH